MILIECPFCGEKRPEIEFRYAGQAHLVRPKDPAILSDEEWAEYLFIRENNRGLHYERWVHQFGCGRFFDALRDTVTDKFVATYKPGDGWKDDPSTGKDRPR